MLLLLPLLLAAVAAAVEQQPPPPPPPPSPPQCRCSVCRHGDIDELLAVSNRTVVPGAPGLYLSAQRGTTSNRKKKQKPVFLLMCERRPLPGYPHTMQPSKTLRMPRVMTTNPSKLSYGQLFRYTAKQKAAVQRHCVPTGNRTALFLGDSLTFGTLVQSRLNWPTPLDPVTGADPNTTFHNLAVYWRVAMHLLEGRFPTKRDAYTEGKYWWRRTYPLGRGGITAAEFNKDYLNKTVQFLEGSPAGEVGLVSYWLGVNDMLLNAENTADPAASFEKAARETLTAVRQRYQGPLVVGTVFFGSDPGRGSGEWLSRRVWYNWAVDPINAAVRSLAAEFQAGVADYGGEMLGWRKHLPHIDGVHPAWWAHKVLAMAFLKGLEAALDVMPARYCNSTSPDPP